MAGMIGLHSYPKEQRETIRQILKNVLMRDLATLNPERFRLWIKDMDQRFRRVGLTLSYAIDSFRTVTFTVNEIRTRRKLFHFASSTHVPFDERDIMIPTV